jgi:DNA-binding response OmpR family regulator
MNDLMILKNFNVLYVDDDPDAREKLQSILSYYFDSVYLATNGLEAYEIYKSKKCDVLLVDYDMPVMDGNEFLMYVRKENDKIPAVIISSYEEKEKLRNAIKLQLVDYLLKPYSLQDLQQVLLDCLDWMVKNALLEITIDTNCSYNFAKKSLIIEDKTLQLTSYESKILEYLLQNQNQIIPYDTLLDMLNAESTKKSLITIVYKLKKKIPVNIIKNIKDEGYILKLP